MQREKLNDYEKTVRRYLPYVLVKCTKYTNRRRTAEYIAFYTFTGAYRLSVQLDGANKIPVLIDSMLTIAGPDFSDGPNKPVNGQLLFENKDALRAAKKLADMDMEECLSRMDCVADSFDRLQLDRITEAVMDYLIKWD
jgi:hypothetical protein